MHSPEYVFVHFEWHLNCSRRQISVSSECRELNARTTGHVCTHTQKGSRTRTQSRLSRHHCMRPLHKTMNALIKCVCVCSIGHLIVVYCQYTYTHTHTWYFEHLCRIHSAQDMTYLNTTRYVTEIRFHSGCAGHWWIIWIIKCLPVWLRPINWQPPARLCAIVEGA